MLTSYRTAIFAHLQVQQAWLTPPHSTFCAICLHSALFVCTQLIFNALRSVCRGDIPTLLSALPTLLSTLPTLCLHYLHFVYTTYTFAYTTYTFAYTTYTFAYTTYTTCTRSHMTYNIGDAFDGHRESRFSVTPTSFTPSLYPHSVPAQHIIYLYMQDNADEVQVVQAVQTKVQVVQTKVQVVQTKVQAV